MKKNFFLFTIAFLAMSVNSAFADTNWGDSGVSLTINGTTSTYWLGGNYNNPNRVFNHYDNAWVNSPVGALPSIGITPTTTIGLGGIIYGAYWNSDAPDVSKMMLYYRIDGGSWIAVPIDQNDYTAGNNYEYVSSSPASINVSGLSNGPHTLEVVLVKAATLAGLTMMTPAATNNAGLPYDASASGYSATLTMTGQVATGVPSVAANNSVTVQGNNVIANFEGAATVQIASVAGQLVVNTTATNGFVKTLPAGVYVVKVNGKATKVMVP